MTTACMASAFMSQGFMRAHVVCHREGRMRGQSSGSTSAIMSNRGAFPFNFSVGCANANPLQSKNYAVRHKNRVETRAQQPGKVTPRIRTTRVVKSFRAGWAAMQARG